MKYLLDTNVFRDLAEGDLPEEAAKIEASLGAGIVLPFYTCEIVIDELLGRLGGCSPSMFSRIRSSFLWMDRICGNSRVAPSLVNVGRLGFYSRPQLVPDDDTIKRNRLRRMILKAQGMNDLTASIRSALVELRPYLDTKLDSWAEDKEQIRQLLRSTESARSGKLSQAEVVAFILETHRSSLREVATRFESEHGPQHEPARLDDDFREFSYFEVGMMMKAVLNDDYNFAKHRNDCHDHKLCAYIGLGFVLVTRDRRILDNLSRAGCPSPRVATLAQALEQAIHAAG